MVVSITLCFVALTLCYITSYHTEALIFNGKIPKKVTNNSSCVVSNWNLGNWVKTGSTLTLIQTRKVLSSPKGFSSKLSRCPTLKKTATSIPYTTRGTATSLLTNFYNLGARGPVRRKTAKFSSQKKGRIVDDSFISFPQSSKRDILLVVDSSGSIGSTYFNTAKPQIGNLLGMVCPAPDPFANHHQAALIQFSKIVQEKFDFNDKANTWAVKNGINSMAFDGSTTCTADAFKKAYDMFHWTKGMRFGVKHELLLLSDGVPFCPSSGMNSAQYKAEAVDAAEKLRNEKGVEIYALVIGNNAAANLDEMMKYVSLPLDTHLFALTGYQELQELVGMVEAGIDNDEDCAQFD